MSELNAVEVARQIHGDRTFYVEARVGSANHRNRGGHNDPCRATWDGARHNEPADGVILALAAQVAADHPADDGEPADRPWMLGIGFMGCADHAHLLDIPIDGWHLFLRVHMALREAQIMQAPVGGESVGVVLSKTPVKTRGHVRRLCATLGVPLRPTEEE